MNEREYIIITEYRKKLETLGIRAKKIILYGSRVSGMAREHSDLDLVVVSDDFSDMDVWDRLCLLGRARKGISRPMEILGLTVQEFDSEGEGSFIGDEVKSKGLEVL